MGFFWCLAFSWCQQASPPISQPPDPASQTSSISRSRLNGPAMNDPVFQSEKSGFAIFSECVKNIQQRWVPMAYQEARAVELDVHLKMKIQPPRGLSQLGPQEFSVNLSGLALPNEQYHLKLKGELGEMDLVRSATKKMLVYHPGKSISDQIMPRGQNANLQSFRSYALRYLGLLQTQVLTQGGYRLKYVGSGNYQGQLIDRISIAKPAVKRKNKEQPVPMNRLWTFWQEGQYELWIFQGSHLPAAIFYSNTDDNIYANITFSYNSRLLPSLIMLQNNSSGFEGGSEIQITYSPDNTLQRIAFYIHTSDGHDLSFDAQLAFSSLYEERRLIGIPPFGYQKMNPDHQKLLIIAQFAGNLLNLKQHGLKLKNFKF